MNINGIVGNNALTYQNIASGNNVGKSFSDVMNGVANSQTQQLTIHKSAEGDADKSIGTWLNPNAGRSITVYEPQNFDAANPVYKVKVWDSEDKLIEEREVDINSVNPNHADFYDLYALSVYGEKSGKCPDAVARFAMMHAKREIEQTAQHGSYALDIIENWLDILKDYIGQQYKDGNLQGYMNAKRYYEFLEGSK